MSLYLGENLISGQTTLVGESRNIGQIIPSAIPLTDAGLHLLDGALIQGSGIYSAFVDYIAGLVSTYPSVFTTESNWQSSVTTYGVCGKFVYDSTANTVRLPKITGIIEGTTDVTALGDLVEAGLPNIIGTLAGILHNYAGTSSTGAFRSTNNSDSSQAHGTYSGSWTENVSFDASLSNSIYGNSSTVQPQTIKAFYYIVIATTTKTDIQVDIDEIATDLNAKADVDLSNINPTQNVKNTIVGWGMPDYTAGVIKTNNTEYIADIDGFLVATTDDYNGGKSYLYVNDVRYWITSTNDGTYQLGASTITMLIPKGTSYKVVFARVSNTKCIFYPLKGVN